MPPRLDRASGPPDEAVPLELDPSLGAMGISSVSAVSPGGVGVSPILFEPDESTPLETGEPGGGMPNVARWAMKDRSHIHRPRTAPDEAPIDMRLGTGPSTLYVVDDGPDHCMISRLIGRSPDQCVYCLVARISMYEYEQLVEGEIPLAEAFADARDICLCGVFEDVGASNVIVVAHYRHGDSVPDEYLPPAPFREFPEPLVDED